MEVNYTIILLGVLPSILYAVAGLLDAIREKEKVQWGLFWKTIIMGFVLAGLVTRQTADMLIVFTSTGLITYLCDKLLNAILRMIGLAE